MDTVIYTDSEGMQVLITPDALPSIVMDLEDAVIEIEEHAIGDKGYIHFRKEDGMTLTLVLTTENSSDISRNLINLYRVRKGYPPIDIEAVWNQTMGDSNE